uniref:zinc finger protein 120-like n=1 Tax=Arvicanthis niloticus TaxID=61156 RepID=UPI00402B1802
MAFRTGEPTQRGDKSTRNEGEALRPRRMLPSKAMLVLITESSTNVMESNVAITGSKKEAVSFDDVHVNFTEEEWNLLDPSQKNLYKDAMLETYWNLTAIGYYLEDHYIEEQHQTSRSHER